MNVFIVNQNPKSKYEDIEGFKYNFPRSIPCGRMINEGDFIVFNIAKKVADRLKIGDKRLTGVAKVSKVEDYFENGKNMANAYYDWYFPLSPFLSFEDLFYKDPRSNIYNAINKVDTQYKDLLFLNLVNHYALQSQ